MNEESERTVEKEIAWLKKIVGEEEDRIAFEAELFVKYNSETARANITRSITRRDYALALIERLT